MKGKPKFKRSDKVKFQIDGHVLVGEVHIVDAYGVFEDGSDVYYDILAPLLSDTSQICLYKHIKETLVSKV